MCLFILLDRFLFVLICGVNIVEKSLRILICFGFLTIEKDKGKFFDNIRNCVC